MENNGKMMKNHGKMMKNHGKMMKNHGKRWKTRKNNGKRGKTMENDGKRWTMARSHDLPLTPRRAVHFTQKVKEDSARHRGALQRKHQSFQVWKAKDHQRSQRCYGCGMLCGENVEKMWSKVSEVLPRHWYG